MTDKPKHPQSQNSHAIQMELERLRAENQRLRQRYAEADNAMSIAGVDTMTMRLDRHQLIGYVNSAFCQYLGRDRDELLGQPLRALNRSLDNEILKAMAPPHGDADTVIRPARDSRGRSFEVKVTVHNDGMDIVLRDTTDALRWKTYVQRYVAADLDDYSEDELSTFKYPERRFMTVSFTDLRGFTSMSETMTPEEVRTTVNAYLEAVMGAIQENRATVDKIVGDEVMALYGAPRYYANHALRAVKTVCDQIQAMETLQAEFSAMGKKMPSCGIGLNTGEMVVGNIGSQHRQDYTVLGAAVNLAARLCGAAAGGQILTTEATVEAVCGHLPDDWQTRQLSGETAPVDTQLRGKTEAVTELPEHLKGKIVAIGPNLDQGIQNTIYRFAYLYAVKVKGVDRPVPVLSIQRLALADRSRAQAESSTESDAGVLADERKNLVQAERIFGRYRLVNLLGRGGMGEVWQARDSFGNTLAVKMLIAGEGASESQLRRFEREAHVMAKLSHRNICRIFEVGEFDKTTYIAMEMIQGVALSDILRSAGQRVSVQSAASLGSKGSYLSLDRSVSQLVKEIQSVSNEAASAASAASDDDGQSEIDQSQEQPSPHSLPSMASAAGSGERDRSYRILPLDQTLAIMIKVCQAIQFAHDNGVFHRDLKPANIMLRPDGEPVVMDFGLAKMDNPEDAQSLSVSEQILGTIDYMAPEQATSAKHVDARADVYALGAILYQMACGRRHFISSGNLLLDAQRLQTHDPRRPRVFNPSIDNDLETIILKALHPDKQDRYANVAELMEDLERYRHGDFIRARNLTFAQRIMRHVRRHKTLAATVGIAASLLLFVGFGSILAVANANYLRAAMMIRTRQALRDAELQKQRTATQQYRQWLVKAQHALNAGNLDEAHRQLMKTDPTIRGWEFEHLLLRAGVVMPNRWADKLTMPVRSMAISHNGQVVAALGREELDLEISIWNAETGKLIKPIMTELPVAGLTDIRIALSPDGSELALSGIAPQVLIYNLISNDQSVLTGHDAITQQVAWSPDGRWIATAGGLDQTLRIWDATTHLCMATITDVEMPLHLAWSNDQQLAVTTAHNNVKLYKPIPNKTRQVAKWAANPANRITCRLQTPAQSISFSSDNQRLAILDQQGLISTWDTRTGEMILKCQQAKSEQLQWIQFCPNNQKLISASTTGSLTIFDVATGMIAKTIGGINESATCRYDPNNSSLYIGFKDGRFDCRKLDISAHDAEPKIIQLDPQCLIAADLAPAGKTLLAIGQQRGCQLVDAQSGQTLKTVAEDHGLLNAVFVPNQPTIAVIDQQQRVQFWQTTDNQMIAMPRQANIAINPNDDTQSYPIRASWLSASPDGRFVMAGGLMRTFYLIETENYQLIRSLRLDQTAIASCCAWAPEQQQAVVGFDDGTLVLYDLATGQPLKQVKINTAKTLDVAWSPDRQWIAATTTDQHVRIYKAKNLQIVHDLTGFSSEQWALAFSVDGTRLLAAGSNDNQIWVWDTQTARHLITLDGHDSMIRWLKFNDSGSVLFSASGDGTAMLWHSRAVTAATTQPTTQPANMVLADTHWRPIPLNPYHRIEGHPDQTAHNPGLFFWQ